MAGPESPPGSSSSSTGSLNHTGISGHHAVWVIQPDARRRTRSPNPNPSLWVMPGDPAGRETWSVRARTANRSGSHDRRRHHRAARVFAQLADVRGELVDALVDLVGDRGNGD